MRGRIIMDKVQVATAQTQRSKVVSVDRARRARAKGAFVADQRGAVAFEAMIVYPVLVALLLMPLADLAAASFQFISAKTALRSSSDSDSMNEGLSWMISRYFTTAPHVERPDGRRSS